MTKPTSLTRLQRVAIYSLGFLFPPILTVVLVSLSAFSELMIHKAVRPLTQNLPVAPPIDAAKPTALIVVSNTGTELTDLLGTYEVLAETGIFNVVTAAPARVSSPTTGVLSILPDFTFEEAPKADILVIPAVLDPTNPVMAEFVRTRSATAKKVLIEGEGAILAANAELLVGRKATSHFMVLPELKKNYPATQWIETLRVVQDEAADHLTISCAGIVASVDGALAAISNKAEQEQAASVADRLGLLQGSLLKNPESLTGSDFGRLVINTAFDWNKPTLGIFVYPGVSEISLAAYLDVLPRTLRFHLFTFAPEPGYIRTLHGLMVLPTQTRADAHAPDRFIVPSSGSKLGVGQSLITGDMKIWLESNHVPINDYSMKKPGESFTLALTVASQLGSSSVTSIIAHIMEFPEQMRPTNDHGPIFSWIVLSRIILLGFLGVFLVWMVERRILGNKRGA